LKSAGIHGFISAADVPGKNVIGPVFKDEELFATEEVHHHGQLIGLVVGDTQLDVQEAARLVDVEYDELQPILTVEVRLSVKLSVFKLKDAIEANSFFQMTKAMTRGNVDTGFHNSDHVIEGKQECWFANLILHTGEIRIGGQEHFYLETQASLVIPKGEDNEIEIWASTQNPSETQHLVSVVLGVPSNKIVCRVILIVS
jgi:xanthine dehydrogenase/oxidase